MHLETPPQGIKLAQRPGELDGTRLYREKTRGSSWPVASREYFGPPPDDGEVTGGERVRVTEEVP
ncbi:hypothetical protein E2C01_082454 [Portunus trituberculatus]|uniref:Uncharacterized protein n=1 Tax=Portunus trituberculatus TaxID=210409 RepID=A0A5B7IZ64_PORTR|nr:hypothetical protein [Portunus trituberculatus]